MQHPLAARREAQPAGVIDTISAGYAALNRQLWVLLLPVLVDLFLWLGPQVSFSPLIEPLLLRGVDTVRIASAQSAAEMDTADTADIVAQYDTVRLELTDILRSANALVLLSRSVPLDLPSLAAVAGGAGEFRFIQGWGQGLLLLLAAAVGGLGVGGLLRSLLAEQVREASGTQNFGRALRRVPLDVLKAVAFGLLWFTIIMAASVPAVLLIAIAAIFSANLALILLALFAFVMALVEIHLFFTVSAIFISGLGPIAAMRRSVGLVRRWFGPTIGLFLLSSLITTGMQQVWLLLTSEFHGPLSISLSILGNAYIACGLIAATMIFYKERADAMPSAKR